MMLNSKFILDAEPVENGFVGFPQKCHFFEIHKFHSEIFLQKNSIFYYIILYVYCKINTFQSYSEILVQKKFS